MSVSSAAGQFEGETLMGSFDDVVDVVIVGSGSAAMTAALAVKEAGKEPLVL